MRIWVQIPEQCNKKPGVVDHPLVIQSCNPGKCLGLQLATLALTNWWAPEGENQSSKISRQLEAISSWQLFSKGKKIISFFRESHWVYGDHTKMWVPFPGVEGQHKTSSVVFLELCFAWAFLYIIGCLLKYCFLLLCFDVCEFLFFYFFLLSFTLVCLFYLPVLFCFVFKRERKTGWIWMSGEPERIGGSVDGGQIVIRIYCIEKIIPNKK